MKTITYTNNQGLELKINKFSSGQFKWAFSLTFNNGVHTFCYTMTELRTILLKNGMTRKWAANVKDRFDPLTEEHVLINRYRTHGGSEMEVSITSRIPFVNMIGTGLDMGYMKPQLLEHKLNQTVLIPGIPTFFLIFQSKNFLLQKTFLTFVIQTKG
nr:MAG: hypothetical protein [Bacteriophage sp.]